MFKQLRKKTLIISACAAAVTAGATLSLAIDPIQLGPFRHFSTIDTQTYQPVMELDKKIPLYGNQDPRAMADCVTRGARMFVETWASYRDAEGALRPRYADVCIVNNLSRIEVTEVGRVMGYEQPSVRYDEDSKTLLIKYTVQHDADEPCGLAPWEMRLVLDRFANCYTDQVDRLRREAGRTSAPAASAASASAPVDPAAAAAARRAQEEQIRRRREMDLNAMIRNIGVAPGADCSTPPKP